MNQNFPDSDNNLTKQYIADFLVGKLTDLYINNSAIMNGKLSFLEPGCGELSPFSKAADKYAGHLHFDITAIEYRSVDNPFATSGIDFLNPEGDKNWRNCDNYDIIATNPPFSKGKVTAFLQRSLSLLHPRGFMGFFFALNFLASGERKKFYDEHPPYEVITLSHRPSFIRLYDGKKGTDQREYCCAIWGGSEIPVDKTILTWTDIKDPDKKGRKR